MVQIGAGPRQVQLLTTTRMILGFFTMWINLGFLFPFARHGKDDTQSLLTARGGVGGVRTFSTCSCPNLLYCCPQDHVWVWTIPECSFACRCLKLSTKWGGTFVPPFYFRESLKNRIKAIYHPNTLGLNSSFLVLLRAFLTSRRVNSKKMCFS